MSAQPETEQSMPPQEEKTPVFDLNQVIAQRLKSREPISLQEVYLLRTLLMEDRLERERLERQRINPDELAKAINEAIVNTLKPLLENVKPKTEEIPDWAKEIQARQQEILQKLSREEQEKQTKSIIAAAQEPLKAEIEKERLAREALIKEIQTQLQFIQEAIKTKSEPPKPPENPLKIVKETLTDIAETAEKIGYTKAGNNPTQAYYPIQGAKGGVPISGSIPAWWIFIPSIVDDVLNSIEKRLDKFIGFMQPTPPSVQGEELIKLPETPIITPSTPKVEIKPEPEIIKIEPVVSTTPPEEVKPPKTYQCICGETFTSSLAKARHAKKCPKAKEEREKKKSESTAQS